MEDEKKMDKVAEAEEFAELTDDEAAQVSGGIVTEVNRISTTEKIADLGDDQTQKQQEK